MKIRKFEKICLLGILAVLFLVPTRAAVGQDTVKIPKKTEKTVPKSELDSLKAEWEAVREQQVRMILEKEDQLEKLKEEIFSKMKSKGGPVVAAGGAEFEAQKLDLQIERQKFFVEMSRQKESLRQLQTALDEKTKQLAAERERFEREKKMAVR